MSPSACSEARYPSELLDFALEPAALGFVRSVPLISLGRAGQWDDAIRAFREAVARDPGDALSRKNLGAALSQAGHLDEARDHLKAAVVLLPSDPQAWLNLAMNFEQSGVTTESETATSVS